MANWQKITTFLEFNDSIHYFTRHTWNVSLSADFFCVYDLLHL